MLPLGNGLFLPISVVQAELVTWRKQARTAEQQWLGQVNSGWQKCKSGQAAGHGHELRNPHFQGLHESYMFLRAAVNG